MALSLFLATALKISYAPSLWNGFWPTRKTWRVEFCSSPFASHFAPTTEIRLLEMSNSVRVLFAASASPTALAPSSAKPFQDKSRNFNAQLFFSPYATATAPFLLKWFQLKSRYSNPTFPSIAGPSSWPPISQKLLWLRFRDLSV